MPWCLHVSTVRLLEVMRQSVFTRCKNGRTKAKKNFGNQSSNKSKGEAGGKGVNGYS
jgi:hypothetical protein